MNAPNDRKRRLSDTGLLMDLTNSPDASRRSRYMSPPSKRPRAYPSPESSADAFFTPIEKVSHLPAVESQGGSSYEGSTCPVCLDRWTASGPHRVCCLKCGHIFGLSCIEKWIKQAKSCATCKEAAKIKDIRHLFVPRLAAVDDEEKDKLLKELVVERTARAKVEAALQEQILNVKVLERKLRLLERKDGPGEPLRDIPRPVAVGAAPNVISSLTAPPVLRPQAASPSLLPSPSPSGEPVLAASIPSLATPVGSMRIGEGRIVRAAPLQELVLASDRAAGNRWPFGVRKVSMMDFSISSFIGLHAEMIRDIKPSPHRNDHRAVTCSIDKTLKICDLSTGNILVTFSADSAVWSCEWNESDPNQIFAGLANGQILVFDLRSPSTPLSLVKRREQPIHCLQCVQPHDSSPSFLISGSLSGVKAWRLPAVEERAEPLPLPSGCFSLSFERGASLLLSSFKSIPAYQKSALVISELQCTGESLSAREFRTLYQDYSVTRVTRSAIKSALRSSLVASIGAASSIDLWNAKTGQKISTTILDAIPLDLCLFDVNDRHYLVAATAGHLNFYSIEGAFQ